MQDKIAIIRTNLGDLYLFFFMDKAPNHVKFFMDLAKSGFYKKVRFHRIVPGFMAQAGIPRDDWSIDLQPLKLEVDPQLHARHRRGAISAARTKDPNSATSQFFLVFKEERAKHLDSNYSVYGQVFKGFETLEKLEAVEVGPSPMMGGVEISEPQEDVHIIDVVIEKAEPYKAEIDKWKADNGLA